MPILKGNVQVHSLAQWAAVASPKLKSQWADGRSAKELARAWLETNEPNLPPEVAQVLATHEAFGVVQQWKAEPEAKLPFDEFDGEPRNSDLVVEATDQYGSFLIAVEGKADEAFGELVGEALAAALERHLQNERSNGIARIQRLAHALFGARPEGTPPLKRIRYQLMTACAGAISEAERRHMTRAIVLIHEFVTDKTVDKRHDMNSRDLDRFVSRVSHGSVSSVQSGRLHGPFTLLGAPLFSTKVQLYIGKAIRNLRKRCELTKG
jgi:hypothetical protein